MYVIYRLISMIINRENLKEIADRIATLDIFLYYYDISWSYISSSANLCG